DLRARLQTTALRTALVTLLPAEETVVGALTSGPGVVHAAASPGDGVLADLVGLTTPLDLDHDQVDDILLAPSVTDDHILYVQAPAGRKVTLEVDGAPAIPTTTVGAGGLVGSAAPLPLTVGTAARLRLTLASLPAATVATLAWRTKGLARSPIPADRLTPASAAADADASPIRLHQAGLAAGTLAPTPGEAASFAAA